MTTDLTHNLNPGHWITNSERITLEPNTEVAKLAQSALFNISKAMARMRMPGTFKDAVDYTLPSYCHWWQSLLMRLINEDPKAREGEWLISLQKQKHIFKEYLTTDIYEAAEILKVDLTEHEERYLFGKVYELHYERGYKSGWDITRPFECHELFPGLVFVNSGLYETPINLLYNPIPKAPLEDESRRLLNTVRDAVKQLAEEVKNPFVGEDLSKASDNIIIRPVMHYDGRNIAPGPHVPTKTLLVILPIPVVFKPSKEPWDKQFSDMLIMGARRSIDYLHTHR